MINRSKILASHKKTRGKIAIKSKMPLRNRQDLSIAYTPGVAEVAKEIAKYPAKAYSYTNKGNLVAIVSDGTAVLGLGDVGPEAALPVMEGKALLFKELADVDAVPICINTKDVNEIVKLVKQIEPNFGGINLEDISAPRCFAIEARLKKELKIPVFHDDQHGTAIVVLAGLINAAKVVKKNLKKLKVVVCGAGASGTATTKMLYSYGIKNIVVTDSKGIIYLGRKGLNKYKKELAKITNKKRIKGKLAKALKDADVFIGLSNPKLVTKAMVKSMAKDPIIFALANPVPEIMPQDAKQAGAKVIATGRSDFPNQINNVWGYPGVFKGVFTVGAKQITDKMKIAAAEAVAAYVKKPTNKCFVPDSLDKKIVNVVAQAIIKTYKKK